MIIGISGRIGSGKDTVGKIIQYLTYLDKNPNITKFKDKRGFYTLQDYIKGSASNNIEANYWQIKKFASRLKEIVSILTGCTIEDLESQEFKDKVLPKEWWTYNHLYTGTPLDPCMNWNKRPISDLTKEEFESMDNLGRINKPTYRSLLQQIGTEGIRKVVGENTWVNSLFSEYKDEWKGQNTYTNTKKLPNWIITDVRFTNELKAIEDRNGITIRVSRREFITETLKNGQKITSVKGSFNKFLGIKEHPSETALDNAIFKYEIFNDGSIEDLIKKVKEKLILEKII